MKFRKLPQDLIDRLIADYPGETLNIPLVDKVRRQAENVAKTRMIMADDGSAADVMRELSVTRNTAVKFIKISEANNV